jgi:hypothetical protein
MKAKGDPGLFCGQLDWLLNCSSHALGRGGTMAVVVSTIERGGAAGGGEDANYGMLRRVGFADEEGARARENVVARERQLSKRFALVDSEARRLLLARYCLGADSKVESRFGKLAGVALYLWVTRAALDRAVQHAHAERVAADALTRAAELEHHSRAARVGPTAGFGQRSRAWLVSRGAQVARAQAATLQQRALELAESPATMEDDARALASACTLDAPPLFPLPLWPEATLEQVADQRCREAHKAWRETAKQEAARWANGEDEDAVGASPAH